MKKIHSPKISFVKFEELENNRIYKKKLESIHGVGKSLEELERLEKIRLEELKILEKANIRKRDSKIVRKKKLEDYRKKQRDNIRKEKVEKIYSGKSPEEVERLKNIRLEAFKQKKENRLKKLELEKIRKEELKNNREKNLQCVRKEQLEKIYGGGKSIEELEHLEKSRQGELDRLEKIRLDESDRFEKIRLEEIKKIRSDKNKKFRKKQLEGIYGAGKSLEELEKLVEIKIKKDGLILINEENEQKKAEIKEIRKYRNDFG